MTPRPTYEMMAHLVACACDIAGGDRSTDRAVLDDGALGALRDDEDRHQRTADDVADSLHAVEDHAIPGRLRNGEVEP
jgi:hypothetical protein